MSRPPMDLLGILIFALVVIPHSYTGSSGEAAVFKGSSPPDQTASVYGDHNFTTTR